MTDYGSLEETVEDFLESVDKQELKDDELEELYDAVDHHYDSAQELDGDDKRYELEVALDTIESFEVVSQGIIKDSHLDYLDYGDV